MDQQRHARHNQSFRPKLDHLEARLVPAPVTWRFRPQFSSVTISGNVDVGFGPAPLEEQGPGSMTTSYIGRQLGDYDLTALTIQFLDPGASNINARNSGSWQPMPGGTPGSAPANYGAKFQTFGTNYVAIRALKVSLTSDPLPLTALGGGIYSFPATYTVNQKSGNLDYQTVFFGSGTHPLSGTGSNTSGTGTLTVNPDGSARVLVPVDATTTYDLGSGATATVNFKGTVGGVKPPSPTPIPSAPGIKPTDLVICFADGHAPVVAPSSSGLSSPNRPTDTQPVADVAPSVVTKVIRPSAKTQQAMADVFADALWIGGVV